MRDRSLLLIRLLPFVLLLLTIPAFAHHLPPGMEEIDEFSDNASFLIGFNHPLTGIDHLLVALLTGMAAAKLRKTAARLLAWAAIALIAGFTTGLVGFNLPGGETMMVVSVIACSLLILARRGRCTASLMALPAVFQLWHGNLHALEMPARAGSAAYAAGTVAATVLLMVCGYAVTILYRQRTVSSLRRATASS